MGVEINSSEYQEMVDAKNSAKSRQSLPSSIRVSLLRASLRAATDSDNFHESVFELHQMDFKLNTIKLGLMVTISRDQFNDLSSGT